jgi:DNA-binding HxlR family transcriptional regulator
MPTTRSYHDVCGIARALDVVGERWAFLVVRELLLGPQRFSELRRVLAHTSANVISDRLRELEANGVVKRRKLAPPSGSWVYELTPRGRDLEPILMALGEWGLQVPVPPPPNVLSATSVLIYLRGCAQPDRSAAPIVVRIELDDQVWTARTDHGRLTIIAGEPPSADAEIKTDPQTLNTLIGDGTALEAGIAAGAVAVSGDIDVLRRLLQHVDLDN